ncbi:uncharacterized protein LOC124366952 [Homalodisca vitripennis]|uniref:uncharacterized protein LOC124366952 n=1 Tax=Homalodisca vitripennis TaxID=197043 RepID=UPI001EEB1568|nr:uncharacterized protein LOC124366952 [Homalodisca vitripennis]KAG8252988.1 hypothetical protein J6590_043981 [Homalodisca vitripennis]KAG8330518.1 hypothetical protein J6590_061918 [Homalodisca vitripennis]
MNALRLSLILLSISQWCSGETTTSKNLNWLVDSLLESTTKIIQTLDDGQIAIPDLEETFHKTILFVKVRGGVKATGGVFQNLTTLHRTGDAVLTYNSSAAKISLLLGMSDMEIHFSHCRVWLGKLSVSESLRVKVKKNSLDAEISLFEDDQKCHVSLSHIRMNEFGDFDTKVKGLGVMNGMVGFLGDTVMNHFVNNIKSLVEAKLHKQLSQELTKYHICTGDIF